MIHLHFWLTKIQLILTLYFISGSKNGFLTILRSSLLPLHYSLWEQSFMQSAENCYLVDGIFTSAWVLLHSATLKITPQLEVIGVRI